jgi:hypothetical protein
MANVDLKSNERVQIDTGLDSIVIISALGDIPGGAVINFSLTPTLEVAKAGHILITKDSDGEVATLGASEGIYSALPTGYSYVGVLKASITKRNPQGSIVTIGQINAAASPYPITAAIKAALPLIQFMY